MNRFAIHPSLLRSGLLAALTLAVAGCTGMAPKFGAPAGEDEVNYTVVPITMSFIGRSMATQATKSNEQKVDSSAEVQRFAPKVEEPYRIGINDVMSLDIFGLPEKVTGTGSTANLYAVQDDGTIILPYAGTVKVADLTLAAARERVMTAMKRYIDSPQFNLRIVDYRSRRILVAGEVSKPGYLFLKAEPTTLIDAIGGAGGLNAESDLTNVTVQRGEKQLTVNLAEIYKTGDLRLVPRMQDGDVVRVLQRIHSQVYVTGAVASPQLAEIVKGTTSLADVLTLAGGISQQSANAAKVYVVRGTPANATIFHLNASSPEALILASNFPLEPKDVVFVTESEVVRVGRILGNLLSPVQGALGLGTSARILSGGR